MNFIDTYFTGKERPALFYYGWMVVLVSFVCHMFIFGIPTVMLPLLYGPMSDQFGWSRSDVTILASTKFLSGAIAAFFVGQFIQRFGTKLTTLITSIIVGLTMISFIFITELWHLVVIGAFLGLGSISLVITVKVIVSRWFHGRIGLALGFALLGTSAAGATLTFVMEPLLIKYGWRITVAILSAGIWFFALPLFLFIARESPDDIGVKTEGIKNITNDKNLPAEFLNFAKAVKGKTFIAIGIGVFLIGFVDQGMLQHTVEYIDKDVGLGRDTARWAFSLIMTISILGKVCFGWLFDKIAVKGVMICYLSIGLGVIFAFPVGGIETLIAFCVARGISHGGTVVDVPYLCRQAFGPAILPRTVGTMTMILSAGFAAGPYVTGMMYDHSGNYDSAFYLLIALSLAATVSLFFVRTTYRDWLQKQGEY
ncbi:MAG: MFS transporter [Emcibacteraceae bacterium]|nr:MFS transporter [Emcibacteraceae bacterium]